MNNVFSHISSFAEKQFGITLHAHQQNRIALELENIKRKLKIDDGELLNGLNTQNQLITNAVIDAITIQESYFFRDHSLFHLLKERYFPALIQEKMKKNDFTIRVWSAGCARGEEIYTVAILLYELLGNNPAWKIELIGSDINQAAIHDATAAIYTKASMRTIEEKYSSLYFLEKENKYYLDDKVKKQVRFLVHNLAANSLNMPLFDLILCRNVFIYMSQSTIEHALGLFFHSLLPEGRLILGPSDFVCFSAHQFFPLLENGVTYFEKKKLNEKKNECEKPVITAHKIYVSEQEKLAKKLHEIREAIHHDPKIALYLIDEYTATQHPTALLYQYKAQALMKLNDIDTADAFCDLALRASKANYQVMLLKGLIQFEKNNSEAAKDFFQKALVIKSDCVEAHYYLAQIALAEHSDTSEKRALVALRQSLLIAKKKDPASTLLGFEEESLHVFIQAVERDIAHLQKGGGHG